MTHPGVMNGSDHPEILGHRGPTSLCLGNSDGVHDGPGVMDGTDLQIVVTHSDHKAPFFASLLDAVSCRDHPLWSHQGSTTILLLPFGHQGNLKKKSAFAEPQQAIFTENYKGKIKMTSLLDITNFSTIKT